MDVTREKSGESIEGAFSAVWLFGQKVANAISPLILGFILSLYGWKETTEGFIQQTDIDQISGSFLMSFILSRSTELLWGTRQLKPTTPCSNASKYK